MRDRSGFGEFKLGRFFRLESYSPPRVNSDTSHQTVFYIGFTAGATADVNNMVLYTTARGSATITAVTPSRPAASPIRVLTLPARRSAR